MRYIISYLLLFFSSSLFASNCLVPAKEGFLNLATCGFPKEGDVTQELQNILNAQELVDPNDTLPDGKFVVEVPPGVYRVNGLIVPSNMHLKGNGSASVFRPSDDCPHSSQVWGLRNSLLRIVNPWVKITDIAVEGVDKIDGEVVSFDCSGIAVGNAQANIFNIEIENVTFSNIRRYALDVVDGLNHGFFRFNFFDGGDMGMLRCINCINVKIEDNVFQQSPTLGTTLPWAILLDEGDEGDEPGNDNSIRNNWFEFGNIAPLDTILIKSNNNVISENRFSAASTVIANSQIRLASNDGFGANVNSIRNNDIGGPSPKIIIEQGVYGTRITNNRGVEGGATYLDDGKGTIIQTEVQGLPTIKTKALGFAPVDSTAIPNMQIIPGELQYQVRPNEFFGASGQFWGRTTVRGRYDLMLSAGVIPVNEPGGPNKGNVYVRGQEGTNYEHGHLVIGEMHIWPDGQGNLRVKHGAPTSATDGLILGQPSE